MTNFNYIPKSLTPIWNALKNAFEDGRFPQTLLLDGTAGVGKKLLAIKLAEMLNKNSAEQVVWLTPIDGKADERDTAAKIEARVRELSEKMRNNPFHTGYITESALISVGMVEWLLEKFTLTASGNRAVIIPNADQMNEEAANKLLKTFEEAPRNTYFILTADSRHSLLKTIRSRAVCFYVPAMQNSEILEILKQAGYSLEDASFERDGTGGVLNFSFGSAGRAMAAIDANYPVVEKKVGEFVNFVFNGDASSAIFSAAGVEKSLNETVLFLECLALKIKQRTGFASESGKDRDALFEIQRMLARLLSKKFTAEQTLQNTALRLAMEN